MSIGRYTRQTVGTSAAVVLAAVVNAAVASPVSAVSVSPEAAQAHIAGNLSWAVSGGVSVQDTRVFLAENAVKAIHSFDRLCGAELQASFAADVCSSFICPNPAVSLARPGAEDHARSTHQNSAP
jgi:hypothetical protein